MQAVVLAAGEGTRMRPLTAEKPKGLVEIAGKPILSHLFDDLTDHVEEFVVVVGYRGDQLESHYGDAYDGTPITYVRQDERRGTAHAVRQATPHVEGAFFLVMGDNVHDSNLTDVFELHARSTAEIGFLTREVPADASPAAACKFGDDGEIVGLVEKPEDPPSRTTPAGFYVLPEAAVHACHLVKPGHTGEYELTDAIDLLFTAGYTTVTAPLRGQRWNVNTPDDVALIEQYLGDSES